MRDRRRRSRFASWSWGILAVIAVTALAAPWITRHSYDEQNIEERLQPPSWQHPMGTDPLGRDLYSRVLHGGRVSLWIGFSTALLALVLGGVTGAIAGYRGGIWDAILMRCVDFFFIFPSLLLAILLLVVLGRGLTGLVLALALTSWVTIARLVRGQVMQAREMPYVEAARALGVRESRILFRHILPNLWGPILVTLTFQIPTNILAESFLSFIGLGVQPPHASWGSLAAEGFRALQSYPYLLLFPGGILFITLLALNFAGDRLRDWSDPVRQVSTI